MGYYLGIDGGGTKTEALVTDEKGVVVSALKGDASNPHFAGKDTALSNLRCIIMLAIKDIDKKNIRKVILCVPGIKEYRHELNKMISIDEDRTVFYGDELNTFVGALARDYGVTVLAGTGSFVIGMDKTGRKCTIGGWGPIIGDPGSGYWMAVQALRAVAMEYDGLLEHTILTDRIKEYYSIENINNLKRVVSMNNISPIAALVKEAAQEEDRQAISIVQEAAQRLAEMAGIVIDRLGLDNKDYSLALTGGVSNFGELIMRPFIDTLRQKYRNIDIVKPLFTPVVGAVMLAMREDDIGWDEDILNNLKISYGKAGITNVNRPVF